jgi:nucleoside phosphorylase
LSKHAPSADVLLVVATDTERNAVLSVFTPDSTKIRLVHFDHRSYYDLGEVGGAHVLLVQTEPGSTTTGGSLATILSAIHNIHPSSIIMVGIAFGVDPSKQATGQVLISKQLKPYETRRIGTANDESERIIDRNEKVASDPKLLNIFRATSALNARIPAQFGTILSGEKLIDNIDYRDHIRTLDPEAIGGEMEGVGLYAAAREHSVPWIIVKAVCDFADGQKRLNKTENQRTAADNAAQLVYLAIAAGGFRPSDRLRAEIQLTESSAHSLEAAPSTKLFGIDNRLLYIADSNIPEDIDRLCEAKDFDGLERLTENRLNDSSLSKHDKAMYAALVADAYVANQRPKQARPLYFAAASFFNSNEPGHWCYLIRAYLLEDDIAEAAKLAEAAIAKFPADPDVAIAHAWATTASGTPALEYYNDLPLERRPDDMLFTLIRISYSRREWTSCVALMGKLKELPTIAIPLEIEFYATMARYYDGNYTLYDKAPLSLFTQIDSHIADFQKLRDRSIKNGRKTYRDIWLETSLHLADCFSLKSKDDDASEILEEVLQRHPGHWAAVRANYLLLCGTSRHDRAMTKMRRALAECEEKYRPLVAADYAAAAIDWWNSTGDETHLPQALEVVIAARAALAGANFHLLMFMHEMLLERQILILRIGGRHEEALSTITGCTDAQLSSIFLLSLHLEQLAILGRQEEAVTLASSHFEDVKDLKAPNFLWLVLGVTLTKLGLYRQGLAALRHIPMVELPSHGAHARLRCLYHAADMANFVAESIEYQDKNGLDIDMARNMIPVLRHFDPRRLFDFIHNRSDECSGSWELWFTMIDIGTMFGLDLPEVPNLRDSIIALAAALPVENHGVCVRLVLDAFGPALAIDFALEHVALNPSSLDVKLNFIQVMSHLAMTWPAALEKSPDDTDTVFHLISDDSEAADFCCYSPPPKFANIIPQPQEGSQIDQAIAAYRRRIDESPRGGFRCTGHGPFWQFLCTYFWKQIVILTGSSNKAEVMTLKGVDALKEHMIEIERKDGDAIRSFTSRVTKTNDIYLALNSAENQIHWLRALTTLWDDRHLCHHSGPSSGIPVRARQPIAVDIIALITFLVATNGKMDLLGSLSATLVGYPGFFRELRNLQQLLSSGERLVLHNREIFIDARGNSPLNLAPASVCHYIEYRSAFSALTVNQMDFMRLITELGASPSEILLSASKDHGTTVWSDSLAQRAYARALGVPTVNTGDILKALHSQGLLTLTEYMRARLRLFSLGYTGAEFTGNDLTDLVLAFFSADGEGALSDLFRGFSTTCAAYTPVVDFVALLALRVAVNGHPSAPQRLDQLLKCISALALRWNDHDLIADVVARLDDPTVPEVIWQNLIRRLTRRPA